MSLAKMAAEKTKKKSLSAGAKIGIGVGLVGAGLLAHRELARKTEHTLGLGSKKFAVRTETPVRRSVARSIHKHFAGKAPAGSDGVRLLNPSNSKVTVQYTKG